MSKLISIDPGKCKCGLVLADISKKKVDQAIVLNSELPFKITSNRYFIVADFLLQKPSHSEKAFGYFGKSKHTMYESFNSIVAHPNQREHL